MAIFTAIIAMLPAWGGAVTIFGLSPGISAAIIAAGRAALWSLASAALFQPKIPRQQVMATTTETDRARTRAYGRNLMGGLRVFFEAQHGRLHQVVVFNHGRVSSLTGFWVDGERVDMTPNAAGLYRRDRYTAFAFRDGSGAGGDYAGVFAGDGLGWSDLSQDFPTLWGASHRLQGQATFYAVLGDPSDEDFMRYFPKGPSTQVQVEFRGALVADLAGAQTYSENAGLCIRDLMTHKDGWAIPAERLDAASWAQFVALCAEPVPLAAGGTEPRYRLCGYYSLDDALKEVTSRMLATCDGQIYETAEGRIGILGGAWSVPEVTITADDILSIEMNDGFDPFTAYNVLKGSFVSPDHAYQPTEVAEIRDEASLAVQGERPDQFDVDMCPSSPQLQRLMKIKFAKDRREFSGQIRTNLVGLKARFPKGDGIHTIRLVAPEFGLNGVFEVTAHSFDIEARECTIGVASIANPYGWTAAQEKPLPPGISDILTPAKAPPVISGISLTQEPVLVSGDVRGGKLVVEIANPGRDDLHLRAQVAKGNVAAEGPWPDPQPVWIKMPATRLRAETALLDDGQDYTVRLQWRRFLGWTKAGTVTVTANPAAPAEPTDFDAMRTGGTVYLDWVNPADDFWRIQIWRGTGPNIANAVLINTVSGVAGQPGNATDAPTGSGTRYYWIRALNASRVPSAFTGPKSVVF